MLTLFIAAIAGCLVGFLTARDLGPAWGTVCGIVTVVAVQLAIGLLIRKKVGAVNAGIQQIMESAHQKINRKLQAFQQRQSGNLQAARQMLEKDQNDALREALAATREAERYYIWNFMLKKQMNTMQMALYYQLKDFEMVDKLLPGCFLLDSRSVAMKMARMFRKNDPALPKFYRKKTRRMRGEDLALVASLYAYIQVKQDNAAGALQTLIDAKKRTDNPVVLENWERLVNNKAKHFSNSGLGDAWYSLYLEEPKMKQQRVVQRPR